MAIIHSNLFDGWDDKQLNELNNLALESKEEELERVFYYQLKDLKELETVADEIYDIHQVEYFLIKDGKRIGIQRTRETADVNKEEQLGDGNQVELTFKLFKGAGGATEYTAKVNQDIVDVLTLVGDKVITKRRYVVHTEDESLKWEIDVPFGEPYDNWVKVDLEVKNMDIEVPKFPIPYTSMFETTYGVDVSDENKNTLNKIFKSTEK